MSSTGLLGYDGPLRTSIRLRSHLLGERLLGRAPFGELLTAHRLAAKYHDESMVGRDQFRDNLLIARAARGVDGAVVECGTWRGGMLAALAELLGDDRRVVGFDSFEGLPPAGEEDGPEAVEYQRGHHPRYHDNCRASEAEFRATLDRSGRPYEVVRGWFDETVPTWAADGAGIALLRLDGDWYDSTLVCLQHLWPLLAWRGVLLVDDYPTWRGCTQAVHEFLAGLATPVPLRHGPFGVTYAIKPEGE